MEDQAIRFDMDTPTPSDRWLALTSPPISPNAHTTHDSQAKSNALPKALPPLAPSAHPPSSITTHTPSGAAVPLTPPTTPEKPAEKRVSISSGIESLISPPCSRLRTALTLDGACESSEHEARQQPLQQLPEEPRAYTKKYDIAKELGQGAWSNVYSAFEQFEDFAPSVVAPLTPPVSPESKSRSYHTHVLAVKVPSERRAHKVLKKEACTLTYLHSRNEAESYLVPFHGFDTRTHSIVMEAIPTSLERLIKSTPRRELSTKTMFDPVIGAETWASLAEQLIHGLAFLQSVGCIHGDIKPANVLVRTDEATGDITPLYCDFSSARVQAPGSTAAESEEITAVTKDYLSPELLVLLLGRNGDRAIATLASDVFALAVTLLAAAIGGSPYACVSMEIQKLSMAKEGVPIEFARQGAVGSRVMKGRAVAKILGPAVEKDAEKRITVAAWGGVAEEIIGRWRESGWTRGGLITP